MEVHWACVISPKGVILADYTLESVSYTHGELEALRELKRRVIPRGLGDSHGLDKPRRGVALSPAAPLDPQCLPPPLVCGMLAAYRTAITGSDPGSAHFAVVTGCNVKEPEAREFIRAVAHDFESVSWSTRSPARACQTTFAPALARRARAASASRPNGQAHEQRGAKAREVQVQVEEVQRVLARNVELVIARGERLEDVQEKSERLHAMSSAFKSGSRRVRRFHMNNKLRWGAVAGTCVTAAVAVPLIAVLA